MCARSYIISWMYHFLFRSCWLLSVAYKPSVCVGWSECGAAYSYRTFCISSLVVVTSTAVYWLLHHHLIFLSILLTPRYCVYTAFTSFYTSLSSSLTHPPTHSLTHTLTHPLTHPPTHSPTQSSIVVIGAGAAGLAAAHHLNNFGYHVSVQCLIFCA